jgi:hypothetical protein
MADSTEHRTESPGRILNVNVFGNTVDEIEMAALDKAREFFGADLRLGLGDYQTSANTTLSAPGKRYMAVVPIHAHRG